MPQTVLTLSTSGPGLYEFTSHVAGWLRGQSVGEGLVTLFVRHTSASLLIQENADPDVQVDLKAFLGRLVPRGDDPRMDYLTHVLEGPDDMPAHIKAALLPTFLCVPVSHGALVLGTWQGLYLVEHRDAPHRRQVVVHLS